jgi:hypothetical protein
LRGEIYRLEGRLLALPPRSAYGSFLAFSARTSLIDNVSNGVDSDPNVLQASNFAGRLSSF